jgi:fatty-acyl-CoA synthase
MIEEPAMDDRAARPSPYTMHLDRNPANHVPLSPLGFIERAAAVFPERPAVVHGTRRYSWAETYARCRRLASALERRGIGKNDTVAVMAPNVPEMFEAHFGVAMAGAVLNALNIRLDAETIAFILDHGEAKALITDREFSPTIEKALSLANWRPLVIDIDDALAPPGSSSPRAIPTSAGPIRPTNGTPSPSTTPPAPRAIPRASSIITAARI